MTADNTRTLESRAESEETITINAFDLDEVTLRRLSSARQTGLITSESGTIDRLADGGAQLILSGGNRDELKKTFPNGLKFTLTLAEYKEMNEILSDPSLKTS